MPHSIHVNESPIEQMHSGYILPLPVNQNKFPNEIEESNYGYVSGYKKPKSIEEQVDILNNLFRNVGFANAGISKRNLPPFIEGYFAIPKWYMVSPVSYGDAVQKVFEKIKKIRNYGFRNLREGKLDDKHLIETEEKKNAIQLLTVQQMGYDILAIPAQFGFHHRGCSVRYARSDFSSGEFGFGAFEVGIMLLTHPERLQEEDDLFICCPGDDAFDDNNTKTKSPYFEIESGKMLFGAHSNSLTLAFSGSVSGFCLGNNK